MRMSTDLSLPKYDLSNRPSWDSYMTFMAFSVSLRSDDRYQKHGAVLINDESKYVLSTGYNNTIRGLHDSIVKPEDRDYRRQFMSHAEINCLSSCTQHPRHMSSSCTIYVTGIPCIPCLQQIINYGIKTIVFYDAEGTITEDETTRNNRKQILGWYNDIVVKAVPVDDWWANKGLQLQQLLK